LEEPSGTVGVTVSGDEHVDDLPVLVNRPVHVPPVTADLHIGLVDEPPATRRPTGEPCRISQQRREPLHPPEDGDMVYVDTTFDQQFFNVSVGEVVC
jgi:hypothetical protein